MEPSRDSQAQVNPDSHLYAGREDENTSTAFPRDSMVSVSLTDYETLPDESIQLKDDFLGSGAEGISTVGNIRIDTTDTRHEFGVEAKDDGGQVVDQTPGSVETGPPTSSFETGSIDTRLGTKQFRHRSDSTGSDASMQVDWEELDREEEQEPRDGGSDESTALLLAQLEQANTALAKDPKSGITAGERSRRGSRPPSIQDLKKLVSQPRTSSLRFSSISSPPPMTELEFWAALVQDFPQTAQRLPTLTAKKLHNGVPPPLRGVVWLSIAGARDQDLEEQYDRLNGAPSPYEQMIGKDIGRSFPGVEMFRDPEGAGQTMLARVLKCFSLYDNQIGYCQGLGFLVGPLLMQMSDREAFCVLVRLMDHYDLRSCFLPDLSGLHLRIFQFQCLLSQHLPMVAAHLGKLHVDATFLSQWFLSFFAVTCPLPMLFRIYDVIFAEGASETLMRVALSVMRRNEKKILAFIEFEDVLQLLLSRALWDPYNCNADDLVKDFVGLTGLVTRESLQSLEAIFKEAQGEGASSKIGFLPDVQAAASKFLGRLWAPVNSSTKSASLSPGSAHTRSGSFLRRTTSKQSIASTLNSFGGTSDRSVSTTETVMTEPPAISLADDDCLSLKSRSESVTANVRVRISHQERDLHGQIEDLLRALSEMQREHALLAAQLQKEREDREEDHRVVRPLVELLRVKNQNVRGKYHRRTATDVVGSPSGSVTSLPEVEHFSRFLDMVDHRLSLKEVPERASHPFDSRQTLRDSVARHKEQLGLEVARNAELSRQLQAQEQEANAANEQLKEARARVQDVTRGKQRLEHTVQELRAELRARPTSRGSVASGEVSPLFPRSENTDAHPPAVSMPTIGSAAGLREFKLGRPASARRTPSQQQQFQPSWGRRSSSLGVHCLVNATAPSPNTTQQAVSISPLISPPATAITVEEEPALIREPETEENARLLADLVNAKTAEAIAREELEETRAKLEALKKMLGASTPGSPPPAIAGQVRGERTASRGSGTSSKTDAGVKLPPKATDTTSNTTRTAAGAGAGGGAGGGGWGWGWKKRSASSGVVSPPP